MHASKLLGMDVYKAAFALFWFGGAMLVAIGLLPSVIGRIIFGGIDLFLLAGVFFLLAAMGIRMVHRESF
ncbi:hypothetical protein H0O03_03615 [Candidatus Micrarchaeota archaeon]|nr:hypothetical protein [Candidatus Micrarchaeota archaeon]